MIEPPSAGIAKCGSALTHLGYTGTIAFFSWWRLRTGDDGTGNRPGTLPCRIDGGIVLELVFVGSWARITPR